MKRLVGFWRQRSMRRTTLLVALAVAALVAVVAVIEAVRRDEGVNVAIETTEIADMTTTSEAIRCLRVVGLSDVEERDVDLWRGFDDSSAYAIVVHKLATPAKAPKVVAGAYAVTGSFKVVAEGTGLTGNEGLEADFLVREVADCLGD